MLRSAAAAVVLFVLGAFVPAASAQESPLSAKRDTEPVVLKGSALGSWSVPANQTVKLPFMDLAGEEACQASVDPTKIDPTKINPEEFDPTSGGIGVPDPSGATGGGVTYTPDACPPQDYAKPEIDTTALTDGVLAGTDVSRILGYRYDKKHGRFEQIPFQVDEVFTRYLDNSRSGFALYSGQDQHTTYAYDREGFRFTDSSPEDPCVAIPRLVNGERLAALPDPVPGLDSNDEIAFMFADAGPRAPATAALPAGTDAAHLITVADPFGSGKPRYVYAMRTTLLKPARAAYTAANGYVRYQRDADADRFAFSESSYDSYGNAPDGPYCSDPRPGKPQQGVGQRRPLDTATIATNRFRFRYDGRWLLTRVEISGDEGKSFGPDLVDRWKARAFAQDPASETPCCGYEEEDSNWGGSSITLGEKVGPVRAIRETWGADSGTNVIRRETFYRGEMRQKTWLRVHVIPPLDGIYAQWDFNAGRVDRFFNPRNPSTGFAIDGRNDEVFGNLDDPCNDNYNQSDTGMLTQTYRQAVQQITFDKYGFCKPAVEDAQGFPYHLSADFPDPTVSDANAALSWSMVTGDDGTIVDRTSTSVEDLAPVGVAQSLLAVPYYRDDACFDDGTGSDPGRELFPRNPEAERESGANGKRTCWRGTPAVPGGDERFWQGSIATHGIHILFIADSDNARLTVPVSEVVAETRMVMLPGRRTGTAGEQYGRGFEKPVLSAALPAALMAPAPGEKPEQRAASSEQPSPRAAESPSTEQSGPAPATSKPGAKPLSPAKAKAKKRQCRKLKNKKKRNRCLAQVRKRSRA